MSADFPSDQELTERLANKEDSFVERKPQINRFDVRKAVCAFANSVRAPVYGVLFIGVENTGRPNGKLNSENHLEAAKTVSDILEELCPPAIHYVHWLNVDGNDVLAVVVPESHSAPHFSGPAYVRKGGKSPEACDEMLTELVADRLSVARELRKWLQKTVTLAAVTESSRRSLTVEKRKEVVIKEVNAHWIVWERTSDQSLHSLPLEEISLQWDPGNKRLFVLIPHVEWEGN